MGTGEDGEEKPVSIIFTTSFQYTRSWYISYDWSLLTVYVVTYVNHLALRAQSQTNMASVWDPPIPHILTFWQEKRYFSGSCGVVGGKGYLKRCSQALPYNLPAVFPWIALSLRFAHFFCTSALIESLGKNIVYCNAEWLVKMVHQVYSQISCIELRVFQWENGHVVVTAVSRLPYMWSLKLKLSIALLLHVTRIRKPSEKSSNCQDSKL